MRDPRTHERALRAALQVARGNRKQTAAAVTGLAMLTGCSNDTGAAANTNTDTTPLPADANGSTTSDTVQALVERPGLARAPDFTEIVFEGEAQVGQIAPLAIVGHDGGKARAVTPSRLAAE